MPGRAGHWHPYRGLQYRDGEVPSDDGQPAYLSDSAVISATENR